MKTPRLRVVPVPCLRDNYAYLLIAGTGEAVVIDPSEAKPVQEALTREGARPLALLCTHHHYDHVGGVPELLAAHPGLPVYGHRYDQEHGRIPGQTVALDDGQRFDLFADDAAVAVQALHVPGHTLGAVAFYLPAPDGEGDGDAPLLFTGDTLFLAGCGRLFEGDAAMMHASFQRLGALPPQTLVYCGHEYTESNLRFAAAVEPESPAIQARKARAFALRAAGAPTIPGTLAEERDTNPFLRTAAPAVRAAALRHAHATDEGANEATIFGNLRHWKDGF